MSISEAMRQRRQASDLALAAMPLVFVFLWSTGFIGARFGLPYAEPMTFLAVRYVIAAALLAVLALASGAPWPRSWAQAGHIAVAGLLIHGVYLGGVFAAIYHGVEAGVAALIVGIQPLVVAIAAGLFLGERVSRRQWLGFALGVIGVLLVVWQKLGGGVGSALGFGFTLVALFAISAGTLYQKRFGEAMDLRSGSVIQFLAAAAPTAALAFLFESREIVWSGEFIFALGWLVIVLSLGAVTLLHLLIRRGAASRVASLFFLVPPSTALIAHLIFGEIFGPTALTGMGLAMLGVALVNMRFGARR